MTRMAHLMIGTQSNADDVSPKTRIVPNRGMRPAVNSRHSETTQGEERENESAVPWGERKQTSGDHGVVTEALWRVSNIGH